MLMFLVLAPDVRAHALGSMLGVSWVIQIKAVPYNEDWSSRERLAILSMCNKLAATIGGCERLVQTPVPLHYVRHTSRFLTIWCLLLPLVIGERLVLLLLAAKNILVSGRVVNFVGVLRTPD